MTMPNILCIGLNPAIDITIGLDELVVGSVNRATDTHSEPAGKGLNVATIASQLKSRFGGVGAVFLSGFLGCDNHNDFLAKFEKFSIKNHCVSVKGSTRQNIKIAGADGTTTDVNGVGFTLTSDDKAKFFERIADDVMWSDFVVVSGSLPRGFLLNDFEKLLKIIADSGKKWAVDTSGQALATAIKYKPFLIKPNEYELAELVGQSCATLSEQKAILGKLDGIENIVVSMGGKGVHWFTKNQVLTATTPKVKVKSTVGAGDTLLSVIVFGLLNDKPKTEILTQAVALAGFAVSQVGFDLASNEKIAELSAQISINEQTI